MSEGTGSGEPLPPATTPTRSARAEGGGHRRPIGAGCLGVSAFYAVGFAVAVIAGGGRRILPMTLAAAVVVGLVLYVRGTSREARAAFGAGFALAVIVFGGCLVLLSGGV